MPLPLLLTLGTLLAGEQPATWYVAPDGNDAWSGRLAAPNAARTDGPWATVGRAQAALRGRNAEDRRRAARIELRGGVYPLDVALSFQLEDSGTAEAPVTFAAYPGEQPVLSGGRAIGGWQVQPDGSWTADVPGPRFHTLWVNGRRAVRARTPNRGYLYTADVLAPFDHSRWWDPDILAKTGFVYRGEDLRAEPDIEDAFVVIYHSWTTSIHRLTALDPATHTAKVSPPSTWPIGYWWPDRTRYHVEGLRSALDEPGEWHFDGATGRLTYLPRPGEEPATAEVIAPRVARTLLRLAGEPATGRTVEYLRFEGLTFAHTDAYLEPDMPHDQQGATERDALVEAVGLRQTEFSGCTFAHAGENGVWLDAGCRDNRLRRCHLHDLGGSGLFIGPRAEAEAEPMLVSHNVVDNCFIHDGSHLFRGSQGVWIGKSSHNQITHCEISDFHHLGISVGHSWGYAPSTAHDNLIAYNRVHHICNGYFSDGGGIYTLGVSPGTVLRGNVVHDVIPTPLMPQGGLGIYHDEGSTGILDEDNLVYRAGILFHQHYGRENIARNNIFAFALRSPVSCARAEEHVSYTFEGNIVLSAGGEATSDHYSPLSARTVFRRNLYWDASGREPTFSGLTFAAWQATGRDADSRVADPLFVDAANDDFRLRPESPALAMGFRPIDPSRAGLYGDAAWTALPAQVQRPPIDVPAPPPPLPPRPFRLDFEGQPTGRPPRGVSLSPSDRPDLIGVTDAQASSGTRAVRVVKGAGLEYPWQPHVYRSGPPLTAGRVRFAFSLRLDDAQPGGLTFSLRDYTAGAYRDGPVIRIDAAGEVRVGDRAVGSVPLGRWLAVEVIVDLAGPRWSLSIGERDAPPLVQLTDQPPAHPAFAAVDWLGLASDGPDGGVYDIDDLRLELVEG